jgi:hypothetical protein
MARTRICVFAFVVAAAIGVGVAAAATPVAGSIAGPVTAVKGSTFTVKTTLSPTGSSRVHVAASTVITEQGAGTRADLKQGVCTTAIGSKNARGVVVAMRVMLSAPAKGQCGFGFGRRGRPNRPPNGTNRPPSGTNRPPNGGGFANFGIASGAITAVKGTTITVHGRQGNASFTLAAKAQITKTVRVTQGAIKVKLCAFVRGTSADKGVTVAAQDVALSKPAAGGCNSRFRRP